MASAPRINENLVIDALDNAVNRENPEERLMAHTDRGSQCTSRRFCRELENRGFVQSFSRKGCPYDNAVMESANRIPKTEFVYGNRFGALREPQVGLSDYMHWHNNIRKHSALGYLSPAEFRKRNLRISSH